MDKRLLELPILTLVGGLILRIVTFITVFIAVRVTSEYDHAGRVTLYIELVASMLIFIVIGIMLRRIYDRKTLVRSATLLVIYSIALLALEQITQYFGIYSLMIHWLYLPAEIFTTITSVLIRLSTTESVNWTYAIPALFGPYLFVLFSAKSE